MTDPQILCPNCSTSIKLTESLAAPLVAETKRRFERQLADKEQQFSQREARLKQAEQELAKSSEAIDERVATQLKAERSKIAETEAKRARLALADELGQRDQRFERNGRCLSGKLLGRALQLLGLVRQGAPARVELEQHSLGRLAGTPRGGRTGSGGRGSRACHGHHDTSLEKGCGPEGCDPVAAWARYGPSAVPT